MGTFVEDSYIQSLARNREITLDEYGRQFVQEGDMRFYVQSESNTFAAFRGFNWIAGRVPYTFDKLVTEVHQEAFRSATRLWSLRARINFEEMNQEPEQGSFILVKNTEKDNSADVGMIGGKQGIAISSWDSPITIAHEIGHALGFVHEHKRPDRDKYVEIVNDNIVTGQEDQFARMDGAKILSTAYDFSSIMHYGLKDFSKYPDKDTIRVREPYSNQAYLCGQRRFFSWRDGQVAEQVYGSRNFPHALRVDARSWPETKTEEVLPPFTDERYGAIIVYFAVPPSPSVKQIKISIAPARPGACDIFASRTALLSDADWTNGNIIASPLRSDWSLNARIQDDIVVPNDSVGDRAAVYQIMLHGRFSYSDATLRLSVFR